MKSEFSREIFENSPKISLLVVHCRGTDREKYGHYELNFTILWRNYKWAVHLQQACKISFLLTVEPISHCCQSG